MVKDDKRGHRSWWWVLPCAAGLALIMTAVFLWPSTSGNPGTPVAQAQAPTDTPTPTPVTPTATPTATATPNPDCKLNVSKKDSPDPVGEGGKITYTITISNDGSGSGYCTDLTVTDTIPTDTDCVSTNVVDVPSGYDLNDADGCDSSGDVVWDTSDNLDTGDDVTLEMVVELTSGASKGDTISNEACATSDSDVGGDCDSENTKVGAPATATPAPTATRAPTVAPPPVAPPPVAPPVVPPTGGQIPSLVSPLTGTGAESGSGGSQPLALALGLAGGLLLLLGGAAMLRRPR